MRRVAILTTSGFLAMLMCCAACTRQQLGLPRVEVEASSPGGRHLAWVKNHLSIDPPAQSLWIRDLGSEEARRVLMLGEDVDWCDTIVWSQDGERVVFLVQDARAVVYDPAIGEITFDAWLVPRDGYPTTRCVRDLGFGASDETLVFRECRRKSGDCSAPLTFSLTTGSRVEAGDPLIGFQ